MNKITRTPEHDNDVTMVEEGRKVYYLWRKSTYTPVMLDKCTELDKAFRHEDWGTFVRYEKDKEF